MDLSPEQRRTLLEVARQTIRSALGAPDGSAPPMDVPDDPVLRQPAGCFVSLHNLATHRLRGCVGRLDARDPLIEAVRQAALNVLHDPRFVNLPVLPADLCQIELEITIVFPLRPAASCLDFELSEGIYLMAADRAGCFLPQVAHETGWSREQLLARLCTEKLGLSADAWQDPAARLMKFHALIVGPEPFEPAPATRDIR
jgi:AmmeMemoRadiSam system protein A